MLKIKFFFALAVGLSLLLPAWMVSADVFRVDTVGNVGHYTSLAIINGNPAISYRDEGSSELQYIRATNADGTTWGTPLVVATGPATGFDSSLITVNGNPAISFLGSQDLKYVRATDADGTTWGAVVNVDVDPLVYSGQYTSMTIVNGNPAISYYSATPGDLKFARATDVDGAAWGTPITIDSAGNVGGYTSLVVANGNPAIAYYDFGNGNLKYVRATDASGTAWDAPLTLDAVGNVGFILSLNIINGNPAIAYYDATNGDLKYIRATDASGTTWGTALVLDSTGTVGWYPSLNIVNGLPAVSYMNLGSNDLKYVRATDANGDNWGTPVNIDTLNLVGRTGSLAMVNGRPGVSYYDQSAGDLKFARACDANGGSWAACTVTLTFDPATGSSAEATGTGNVLRVTTSDGYPTQAAVTVNINVTGGTATATDYTVPGLLTIPAGTAHNSLIPINTAFSIVNDTMVEPDETVQLTLTTPVGAVLGVQTTYTHTLTNDDTASLTMNDVTMSEGNAGLTSLTFTVTLDNAVQGGFTADYSSSDGTATLADNDYLAASGTLSFVGTTGESQTFTVNLNGDVISEPNETLILGFTGVSLPAVIITDTAIGTITNDDGLVITINDVGMSEGSDGTLTFTFSAMLGADVPGGLTVNYVTSDGTATSADNDYLPATGTLTFVGTRGEVQTFTVTVNGDATIEPDETFTVTLSSVSTPLVDISDTATGVILNDDFPVGSVPVSIGIFDPALSKIGFLVPGQVGVTGEQLEWIVTVTNNGTAAGTNIQVTDTLDERLQVNRVETPVGEAVIANQTVIVRLPTLAPGQTVQFSIFTTVLRGVTVSNTACLTADQVAQRCTTGFAVQQLPATGEGYWWRTPLLIGILLVALLLVIRPKRWHSA